MADEPVPVIDRPIIVVGAPRSGTTLLFELLSEAPDVWSIGTESGRLIERELHPAATGWRSGALGPDDLTPDLAASLRREFELRSAPGALWGAARRMRRSARRWTRRWTTWRRRPRGGECGRAPSGGWGGSIRLATAIAVGSLRAVQSAVRTWHLLRPVRGPIRFVEKTPENCLRVPFLVELFPDARIVHLVRSGPSNIASLMEGWRHPWLFRGYDVPEPVRIPGDVRGRWAFTLVPGWCDLLDRPLEEVCARQWVDCNSALLDARDTLDVPWLTVRYEDLVARPADVLGAIARFGEVDLDATPQRPGDLPVVNAVSSPDPDKWRHEPGIERILPEIEPMMHRLGYPMPSIDATSG